MTGNLSLYLQAQTLGIREAWEAVRRTMAQVQERQKAFADEFLRAREHEFEVQDMVLRKRDYFRRDEPTKFAPRWEGPYRILSLHRPNAVIKRVDGESRPIEVHMDKLKHFVAPATLPLHSEDRQGLQLDDPDFLFETDLGDYNLQREADEE